MILWTDHLEIDSYVFPCEPEPTGAAAEDPEGIFVLWARKWRFSKEMTRKWKQEGVIWFVGNDCSWLSPEGRSSLLSFFSFHFTTSCFLTFFFYLFSIFCAPIWFLWFLSSSPRSVSSCWWLGIINWFSQSPGCKQQIKTVSLSLSFFIFLLLLLFLSSSLPLFLSSSVFRCLSDVKRHEKSSWLGKTKLEAALDISSDCHMGAKEDSSTNRLQIFIYIYFFAIPVDLFFVWNTLAIVGLVLDEDPSGYTRGFLRDSLEFCWAESITSSHLISLHCFNFDQMLWYFLTAHFGMPYGFLRILGRFLAWLKLW